MSLKTTENIVVLSAFLAVCGIISALLLGFVAEKTEDPIKQAAKLKTENALRAVLPPFTELKQHKAEDGLVYYGAFAKSDFVGVAGEFAAKGYAGPIRTLVGMNPDGTIRDVLVLSHNETPGLGSNICDRKDVKTITSLTAPKKPGLPPNRILDQFRNRKADAKKEWKVTRDGGDFDFITGATVSSRAVVHAAHTVNAYYVLKIDEMRAAFGVKGPVKK